MEKDRSVCVLYTDAVCNLKCTYCFIDKNPALVRIDKLLDESFKGDYYYEFAKKVFPNPQQLTEVQIWGGEPTLYLERTHYTISKLLGYYPNLSKFMFSTNFTPDDCVDKVEKFVDTICQDRKRNVELVIQLSIDGPTYINDINRGLGVTEKFTKNFALLVSRINDITNRNPNITIRAHFKPTLDGISIRKLQDRDSVYKYFKFLESYQDISRQVVSERFTFDPSVPNTACPSPHTKEEGLLFTNLCKITRELEAENRENKIFDYYSCITPFAGGREIDKKNCYNCGNCGTGRIVVGLLPNDMISCCHNGFTELLTDYKKYCMENLDNSDRTIDFNLFDSRTVENAMVFPYKNLGLYERQSELFCVDRECFQLVNIVSEIQLLARNRQIDSKYTEPKEAIAAANFILARTAYCIRDNLGTTGSKTIIPPGLLKLLLNGAREYIEEGC